MEIDSAMLALGAETNNKGLLHIFGGGFDSMEVAGLPGQLPPFWIVARVIKVGVTEEEFHTFELNGINPKGEPFPLSGEDGMKIKFEPPKLHETSKATIIVQVHMAVRFPGKHEFIISIDNKEMKRIPLTIVSQAD